LRILFGNIKVLSEQIYANETNDFSIVFETHCELTTSFGDNHAPVFYNWNCL
jgi:hypothetical protein